MERRDLSGSFGYSDADPTVLCLPAALVSMLFEAERCRAPLSALDHAATAPAKAPNLRIP